ncbi:DUF3021 domain-containing protein [Metaplanococcus flavidus]|uniref:DUF3021 domain-containing protein n=1 Tax=Metaplanococcus flavidus TaxID=569883 RepID=A0ABW3LD69_9BACL
MKNFLIRSILGIFFGAFIMVVLTGSVALSGQETLDSMIFLTNAIGFMLSGWFFTTSTLYFENPNWSLGRQTMMHFMTVIILYFVLAFVIGWIPFNWASFLLMLGVFLGFYTIFWTIFYLYFKNQAQKLNDELNEV